MGVHPSSTRPPRAGLGPWMGPCRRAAQTSGLLAFLAAIAAFTVLPLRSASASLATTCSSANLHALRSSAAMRPGALASSELVLAGLQLQLPTEKVEAPSNAPLLSLIHI